MAKNFIKKAIKHPGALRRKAMMAGEPTMSFAEKHKADSGTTGQQSRLALTLGKLRHKKSAKHSVATALYGDSGE